MENNNQNDSSTIRDLGCVSHLRQILLEAVGKSQSPIKVFKNKLIDELCRHIQRYDTRICEKKDKNHPYHEIAKIEGKRTEARDLINFIELVWKE